MLLNEYLIFKDDILLDMGCEFFFFVKLIDLIVLLIILFGKNVKLLVVICVVFRMVCLFKGCVFGSFIVFNCLILMILCFWVELNEDFLLFFDSLGCEGDIINLNELLSWIDLGIFFFVIFNKVLFGLWVNFLLWKEIFFDVFLGEFFGLFEIVGLKSFWFFLSFIGLFLLFFDWFNFC